VYLATRFRSPAGTKLIDQRDSSVTTSLITEEVLFGQDSRRTGNMRQRVTFIHKPESAIDPEALKVSHAAISGPDILAIREDRLTFALDELPEELAITLRDAHELHIRWVSADAYDTVEPIASRLSPGFHLFYSPQREGDTDL
jgi:hypothetical protein